MPRNTPPITPRDDSSATEHGQRPTPLPMSPNIHGHIEISWNPPHRFRANPFAQLPHTPTPNAQAYMYLIRRLSAIHRRRYRITQKARARKAEYYLRRCSRSPSPSPPPPSTSPPTDFSSTEPSAASPIYTGLPSWLEQHGQSDLQSYIDALFTPADFPPPNQYEGFSIRLPLPRPLPQPDPPSHFSTPSPSPSPSSSPSVCSFASSSSSPDSPPLPLIYRFFSSINKCSVKIGGYTWRK
ncbi:hypothetical protein ACMFMF_004169 [Clarireedia jacksonii]